MAITLREYHFDSVKELKEYQEGKAEERFMDFDESASQEETPQNIKPAFAKGTKNWSKADDEILIEFCKEIYKKGDYIPFNELREIGDRLGRSFWALKSRISLLKKKGKFDSVLPIKKQEDSTKPLNQSSWTKEEEDKLVKFCNDFYNDKKWMAEDIVRGIAKLLNRDYLLVKRKIDLLKQEKRIMTGRKIRKDSRKVGAGSGEKRAWSKEDEKYLREESEKMARQGMLYMVATKILAEELGRTATALRTKMSELKIPYSRPIPETSKESTPTNPAVKFRKINNKYDEENAYIMQEVKKDYDSGFVRTRRKTLASIQRKLNMKPSIVRSRITTLKNKGLLPKKLADRPKIMEAMRKARELRHKKEQKPKHEPYMKTRKPRVPYDPALKGKVKEPQSLFSPMLDKNQENLIEAMIKNDINNSGISRIDLKKMGFLLNIDMKTFEEFMVDVINNQSKIKSRLKLSVVSLVADATGRFLSFS